MTRLKPALVPAYLLLCLLLGGSAQGVWANALLQLLAIAILAWAAATREPVALSPAARRLALLAGLLLLLFVVQLLPLPPVIWTSLPGREFVAGGYDLLGVERPWLPLSLTPYDTMATALTLLPPAAVLAGMVRLGAFREDWLIGALGAGALASVLVGILQVTSGDSSWYFYRFSNFGAAAGFFANSNHMAALLLATVPFLAAAAAASWKRLGNSKSRSLIIALAPAGAALLGIGILANGSSAVLLLGGPVGAMTALMVLRPSPKRLRQGLAAALLLMVAGGLAMGFLVKDGAGRGSRTSIETRAAIWSTSARAVGDHGLAGAGIGSFEQIYPRYEDPATIERYYVNHAHNDYMEVAIEAGVPGLLLVALFLAWWAGRAVDCWRSAEASYAMKAATIGSAALLLHSVVDFPLRTVAMGAVMAMCLALMAGARGAKPAREGDQPRPARHVTL